MDVKLNQAQLSKIIQSGRFLGKTLGNVLGNFRKKALIDLAVLLAKNVLPKLATIAALSAIDKFERKKSQRGAVRAGKGFTLFISNKNVDDIIKIVYSIENTHLLPECATKTGLDPHKISECFPSQQNTKAVETLEDFAKILPTS